MPVVGRGTNPSRSAVLEGAARLVREFHESNAASVEGMLKALERPRCRFSSDFSKGYMTVPAASLPLKSAGNVLSLEARFAAEEGADDALKLMTNGLRLAAAVEAEPNDFRSGGLRHPERAGRGCGTRPRSARPGLQDLATLQSAFLTAATTTTMTPSILGEAANYSSVFICPGEPW